MTNLHDLTAAEAARQIRDRALSPVELTDALLDRIERSQPTLKAFVTVDAEGARAAARAAEARVKDGAKLGPLHGVPFAAKDIYDAAGLPTTAGYRPLAEHPREDRLVHRRAAEGGGCDPGRQGRHHPVRVV